MEAKIARSLQLSPWNSSENRLPKSNGSLSFSKCQTKHQRSQMLISCDFQPIKAKSWHRPCLLTASCSSQNSQASIMEYENSLPSLDEVQVLKSKSEEIEPYLSGRCIYLVGDTLIEQAVGGTSVAEIFKLHGEGFFRDNETEVLRKLSLMREVVVSTGGGAVVQPLTGDMCTRALVSG
nr:shikimate kinase, chloroplastic [Ipomoea batatas]GME20193.1 shikimate kinase, chloroplastic [Ipomoea batatas]